MNCSATETLTDCAELNAPDVNSAFADALFDAVADGLASPSLTRVACALVEEVEVEDPSAKYLVPPKAAVDTDTVAVADPVITFDAVAVTTDCAVTGKSNTSTPKAFVPNAEVPYEN